MRRSMMLSWPCRREERLDRAKVNEAVRDGLKLGPLRPAWSEDLYGVPRRRSRAVARETQTLAAMARNSARMRYAQKAAADTSGTTICRARVGRPGSLTIEQQSVLHLLP